MALAIEGEITYGNDVRPTEAMCGEGRTVTVEEYAQNRAKIPNHNLHGRHD